MLLSNTRLISRFFSKTSGIDENGCLIWSGAKKPSGYGNFYMLGRYETAHRAIWIIHNGEIPEGMYICHKCDNPQCVNIEHLFLGTPSDNQQDRSAKGRANNGEMSHLSKLTGVLVKDIRRRRALGESFMSLASAFGVCEANIRCICKRKTWRHI